MPSPSGRRSREKIQRELRGLLGTSIEVFLRTLPEVKDIMRLDPFGDAGTETSKRFVTFLSEDPRAIPGLPFISPSEDGRSFS